MREVPRSFTVANGEKLKISKDNKLLLLISVGNVSELYNLTLYGIMLPFTANVFFPLSNPLTNSLFAFLSFALTFIITPLGAIFWGWYGDRYGKLSMINLSLFIMSVPSFFISILPTYNSIGILAPILLVLCRIIQGISASGEIIGSKIFIMEKIGQKSYGLSSGIISSAASLGVLLGMFMGYLASKSNDEHLWRISFLIGSFAFIVTGLIRKYYLEKKISNSPNHNDKISLIFKITKQYNKQSLIVVILGALLGILSYTMYTFINHFLTSLNVISKAQTYQCSLVGLTGTVIASLIMGLYIDKKNMQFQQLIEFLLNTILIITLMIIPFFTFIIKGTYIYIGYIGINCLVGAYACLSAVIMYQLFPKNIRCRGVMFNYALGCSIGGGVTPLLLNIIGNINKHLPGLAIAVICFILYLIIKRSFKYACLY